MANQFNVAYAAFQKCAPNITTNIKQCGSVTACSAKPVTQDELNSIYLKSGDFRVMEALFHHDMEIKMCEAVQNGLYEFFMANKVPVNKNLTTKRLNSGLVEIAPFAMARQYSPINNQYWKVSGGTTAGKVAGADWVVTVTTETNIPFDARSFPVDMRVFVHGKSVAGSATKTEWQIVSVTDNGNNTGTLNLKSLNAASYLDTDKLENPVTGLMQRGTPNKNEFEKYCAEQPTYLNWKNVPFWVETTRYDMCWSSLYDKWRKLVLADNALYKELFDLPEIEKNKQLARDWQDRFVYQMFWGKALPFQTADAYDQLDDITAYAGILDANSNQILGVDGGKCVGKRASAVGIYEQLAQCGRVADALGQQLNLPALFKELYNMMRIRKAQQHPRPMDFDIFTDSVTAEAINQAMITYYVNKAGGKAQFNINGEGGFNASKKAQFGFYYKTYTLFWPQGVTINIITHEFFDDYISAADAVGQSGTARVLWVLDFSGIRPGILASKRKTFKQGNLDDLARINNDFGCVLEVNSIERTLNSVTWTMIVDCPGSNLIIENFSSAIPESSTLAGAYPGTHTSTTSTTQTSWPG